MTRRDTDNSRLRRLVWGTIKAPLNKPYELSFGTLTAFDVVWVLAEDDAGRIGIGEAVPLPGYNWETLQSVQDTISAICSDVRDTPVSEIMERCNVVRRQHPFAVSAVMAAIDFPDFSGGTASGKRFPVSAPVAADWPLEKLRRVINELLDAGFGYIKVKVGSDLDRAAAAAKCILTEFPGRDFHAVFDANQAHSVDEALAFCAVLSGCNSARLQWYEQPTHRDDWAGAERICREGAAPIVLDEAVYDAADVARAAAIGARGVKLKLVKNFGIAETLALARQAQGEGLLVVMGNGVASDIGNLSEYLTLAAGGGVFTAASECNGFAKLRSPVLGDVLDIDGRGNLALGATPDAIDNAIARFAAAQSALC